MRTRTSLLWLFLFCVIPALSAQSWTATVLKDPMTDVSYTRYVLTGSFVETTERGDGSQPLFILECIPGEHHRGSYELGGSLIKAYFAFGTVLNTLPGKGVPVLFRRDGGKPASEIWGAGTAGTAAFPPVASLNEVLFGHILPHRENSSPAVQKLLISADEYLASRVTAQFLLPSDDAVYETCGLEYKKR